MKRLVAVIVVGLITGMLIGYRFAPTPDTSGYEATIRSLQSELETSQTNINELNNTIAELQSELDAAQSNITVLNNRINDLRSQRDYYRELANITITLQPDNANITVQSSQLKVVYQLQNYDLAALVDAQADLYIIDYSWEGDEETRFTATEINTIRSTSNTNILAYMSIGEAEDYRWYWKTSWETNPPPWLGSTNPEWEGNYKVEYWEPEWQTIVYTYLNKIIETGFDGVYLDIIDAYEYWGPEGDSGINRQTAEQEMVDFVVSISTYAKAENPDFLIYPQNGEHLGAYPEYLEAVDGIGREDVWYNDNQPQEDTETILSYLSLFKEHGKQVIVIDYPTDSALIADFIEKAETEGYSWYPGVRDLDTINEYP